MSDDIRNLTDKDFDEAISSGVVLVDFWAPWCGPCKMQTPVLEKVAAHFKGRASVAKLNVDDAPSVAAKYSIRSIPTLMVFNDGEVKGQLVGVQQESALTNAIESEL